MDKRPVFFSAPCHFKDFDVELIKLTRACLLLLVIDMFHVGLLYLIHSEYCTRLDCGVSVWECWIVYRLFLNLLNQTIVQYKKLSQVMIREYLIISNFCWSFKATFGF